MIFSLVHSATYYYGTTLTLSLPRDQAAVIFGKAEAFWIIGYSLLLLEPSLILFTVNLPVVGSYALVLWFSYLFVTGLQYRSKPEENELVTIGPVVGPSVSGPGQA